jgi:hypothetical protein
METPNSPDSEKSLEYREIPLTDLRTHTFPLVDGAVQVPQGVCTGCGEPIAHHQGVVHSSKVGLSFAYGEGGQHHSGCGGDTCIWCRTGSRVHAAFYEGAMGLPDGALTNQIPKPSLTPDPDDEEVYDAEIVDDDGTLA